MKANDLAISYLTLAQLKCVHGFCEIGQNGTYVICHACTHIIYDSVHFSSFILYQRPMFLH